MSAPTLPREVWCWSFGFDPEDGLGALSVMHTQRGAEVEREFDDSRGRPCSPIGRYVLADEERERLLNACVDALREIQMNMAGVASGHLPHFTRKDLAGAAEHRAKAALDRLDAYEEHRKVER